MGIALVKPPPRAAVSSPLVLAAPPSKSIALRALVLGALAGGASIEGFGEGPLPDDVEHLLAALGQLRVRITRSGDRIELSGQPEHAGPDVLELDAGEGGAPARFLLALAATLPGPVRITGSGQLLKRPMAPLIEALEAAGAEIRGGPFLPITVRGPLKGGTRVVVDARDSSQFTSALLLIAPTLRGGLRIAAKDARVSLGYVKMTRDLLTAFGVPSSEEDGVLTVPAGEGLRRAAVKVERDWSGASVLLAASAFLGRPVVVPGLSLTSSQPDQTFALHAGGLGLEIDEVLGGVRARGFPRTPIELFTAGCPDAVPALAALGALVPGWVRLRGAPHLRFKESDRIAALAGLFAALGLDALPLVDGLGIKGPLERNEDAAPVRVTSRGDHRIAMTAALLGLYRPVLIDDGRCVSKSFPGFFEQWPGTAKA